MAAARRPKHECSGRIRLGATQDIRRTGPERARNLQTAKRVGKSDVVHSITRWRAAHSTEATPSRSLPGVRRIIEASRFPEPGGPFRPQPLTKAHPGRV